MSLLNSLNCAFMLLTCKREVKYLKVLVSHMRICSDSCSKTCLQVFLRSNLLIWLGPWQGTDYHMPRLYAMTLPCRTPDLILKDNLLAPDDVPTLPNRSKARFAVASPRITLSAASPHRDFVLQGANSSHLKC